MAADTYRITIDGGSIRFIYDDALASLLTLGEAHTRRASHVEPTADGRAWCADMTPALALPGYRPSPTDGPAGAPILLGPYATRGEALAAERAWLSNHGF